MPHNPGSFSELCVRFWLLLDAGVGMIPVEIAQGWFRCVRIIHQRRSWTSWIQMAHGYKPFIKDGTWVC